MLVEDIMTIDVISVTPETKISQVAALLFDNNLTGVPVVDQSNKMVGIITEYDLMNSGIDFIKSTQKGKIDTKEIKEEIDNLLAVTAEGVMTREVETVTKKTDLSTLTELITSKRINPVPVVDGEGKLVGIVSRSDLVRLLKETDLVG